MARIDELLERSLQRVQSWNENFGQGAVEQVQREVLQLMDTTATNVWASNQPELANLDEVIADYLQFKQIMSAIGMIIDLSPVKLYDLLASYNAILPGFENKMGIYICWLIEDMSAHLCRKYPNSTVT